jgi:hypothetical protein
MAACSTILGLDKDLPGRAIISDASAAEDAGSRVDAGITLDASADGFVTCAALKPFVACEDFERTSVAAGWTMISGLKTQVIQDSRGGSALRVTAVDAGSRNAHYEVASVTPPCTISMDLMIESFSPSGRLDILSVAGKNTSIYLLLQPNGVDAQWKTTFYNSPTPQDQNYSSFLLGAWQHVEIRVTDTTTAFEVKFNGAPPINTFVADAGSAEPIRVRAGFGGPNVISGDWVGKIDNLVIQKQ